MRPLLAMAAGMAVWVAAGAAQDNPEQLKKMAAMKAQAADLDQMLRGAKVIGIEAGIMGPAVKGEPYSAEEIRETNQVLADGTKIHNETKTTVYRDSMGRVRRESPGQIMIWDSAAGTSYVLNQSNQTGHKMLMNYMVRKVAPGDSAARNPVAMPDFRFDTAVGRRSTTAQQTIIPEDPGRAGTGRRYKAGPECGIKQLLRRKPSQNGQLVEGVNCEGSRITNPIEAGRDRQRPGDSDGGGTSIFLKILGRSAGAQDGSADGGRYGAADECPEAGAGCHAVRGALGISDEVGGGRPSLLTPRRGGGGGLRGGLSICA